MPKITLPDFYDEAPHTQQPIPADGPCPLGNLVVLKNNARVYIKSEDAYVTILYPYDDGINRYDIQYTVPKDLYGCVGWNRRKYAFTVIIWDSKSKCVFTIPALAGGNQR